MEYIAVGYFMHESFITEINKSAEIKLGFLFKLMIMFVSPIILTIVFCSSLIKEFQHSYGGYPISANMIIRVGSITLILLISIILSRRPLAINRKELS